jgi:acyl-CoA thioester hydrolase
MDALQAYPVVIDEIVRWGDLDALGHVNNTVFFRYFESARIAYFERIGFAADAMRARIGPILGSTQCRFRRPLKYPDRLRVGARVVSLAEDRFTMEYAVWSDALATLAATGDAIIVAYDYGEQRKAPVPEVIGRALKALEPQLQGA